jgi:two-component system sensor histidine kinase AlgZ
MLSVLKQPIPLPSGAVKTAPDPLTDAGARSRHDCLPDFTASPNVLVLLVIAQVLAFMLSLMRDYSAAGYLQNLGQISMLTLWLAVSSAWLLALTRPLYASLGVVLSSTLALVIVLGNTALTSEAVYWFGRTYGDPHLMGPASIFPAERGASLLRNLLIALVVTAAALRYFYVTRQWQHNVEAAAESRIRALEARIRPHFLFNSMNTIAALTRSDPAAAERAIEDLADLFRASLGKPGEPVSLEQELDVARVYQRMEQQRLGDRLAVDWQVSDLPLAMRLPGLTIQPLLENAIYHGIEPLAQGGVITVVGAMTENMLTISITNPLVLAGQRPKTDGHQIALDNIRQRMQLAYGDRGIFEIEQLADTFRVRIGFPLVA